MQHRVDILIIGGGPAGLATSIFAAQEGFSVALLEKKRFPVDKPCGEGVMPHGVRLLSRMGLSISGSHPFEGIRYVDGELVASARFREGSGLGIRRTELSRAMAARARELGVELHESTVARTIGVEQDRVLARVDGGEIEARWLVAADGLASVLRREQGLERNAPPPGPPVRRFGYRRHYRIRPWSRFVEVHWERGAEAYVTPVGDEEVGVAFLWHERAPSFEAMLARFPDLSSRLRGASPTTRVSGAGPLRRGASRVVRGNVAFVGDASGYVDALTGEGVALAFECAEALVGALAAGSLGLYALHHRRLTRRYRLMAETVLNLALHPKLRRFVMGKLSRHPGWFESLLDLSHRRNGPGVPLRSAPRRTSPSTGIE